MVASCPCYFWGRDVGVGAGRAPATTLSSTESNTTDVAKPAHMWYFCSCAVSAVTIRKKATLLCTRALAKAEEEEKEYRGAKPRAAHNLQKNLKKKIKKKN